MTSPAPLPASVAFIGGGNMARSLIAGLRRQGLPGAAIRVVDPNAAALAALAAEFGVTPAVDAAQALHGGVEAVLLAVKPQVLRAVCEALAPQLPRPGPTVVSIAAGIPGAHIEAWLGGDRPVVRAMPNTPALLGAGASGLQANARCDARDRARAQALLDTAGVSVWVDDETQMDAVTAVSGSGPAYVFRLIEAMQAAARAQGLADDAARTLVLHTVLGAARMAVETGEDAGVLRQRVTSPGGTTAAALAALDQAGFDAAVSAAIAAAAARGAELAAATS